MYLVLLCPKGNFVYIFLSEETGFHIAYCAAYCKYLRASLSFHFCGKMLQYSALNGKKKKSNCCCKGEQKKSKCCKTHHLKVKLDDSKVCAKKFNTDQPIFAVAAVFPGAYAQYSYYSSASVYHAATVAHSPPIPPRAPAYILHRHLLI